MITVDNLQGSGRKQGSNATLNSVWEIREGVNSSSGPERGSQRGGNSLHVETNKTQSIRTRSNKPVIPTARTRDARVSGPCADEEPIATCWAMERERERGDVNGEDAGPSLISPRSLFPRVACGGSIT